MWLTVTVNQSVRLILTNDIPLASFSWGGTEYRKKTSGSGGLGHVDWLRSKEGSILGIRLWHFADNDAVTKSELSSFIESIKGTPFFPTPDVSKSISILFSESGHIQEDQSCDQDLLDSGLYMSSVGEYAIYVDARYLTPVEVTGILGTSKNKRS